MNKARKKTGSPSAKIKPFIAPVPVIPVVPLPTEDRRLVRKLIFALLGVFIFLCVTTRYVGVTYDEPVYIDEGVQTAQVFRNSFNQLVHLNLVGAFESIKDGQNWTQTPMDLGFQRILNGFGLFFFGGWVDSPWLQRGATAVAWTGMLLLLFLLARDAFGSESSGWAAMIIALGTPRLIGHGLLSCTECYLAASWMLSLWMYLRVFKGKSPAWLLGVVCGLALMVKFQSMGLLGALSVWGFLYAPRRAIKIFLIAFPISFLVFFAFQPLYWSHPLGQLMWLINFYAFKSTAYSTSVKGPVALYFLGHTSINAPWYYAPVIWLVSTPLPYLALSLWGLWQVFRKFDPIRVLFLWMALLPMILTMFPGVNVYDGERMFIQAYPAWVLVAAGGISSLWENRESWKRPLLAMTMAVTAFVLIQNFPFYMDYYSGAVGGPVGAQKKGFESSYWYNALNPGMLDYLNREVPPHGGVWMDFGNLLLGYYKGAGKLRSDIEIDGGIAPGITAYKLLYLRQGYLGDIDGYLNAKAAYEVNYRGLALAKLIKVGS